MVREPIGAKWLIELENMPDVAYAKREGIARRTVEVIHQTVKNYVMHRELIAFLLISRHGFNPLYGYSYRQQRYLYWKVLSQLFQRFYPRFVRFPTRTENRALHHLHMSLDGTCVRTHRGSYHKRATKHHQRAKWRAYKFRHKYAGNFQVAFCAELNRIVAVYGIYPGKAADISAIRNSNFFCLLRTLDMGSYTVECDAGYPAEPVYLHACCKKPRHGELPIESQIRNALISSRRWTIEVIFRRMKIFRVLRDIMPSYNKSRMGCLFKVVAAIVSADLKTRPLKRHCKKP